MRYGLAFNDCRRAHVADCTLENHMMSRYVDRCTDFLRLPGLNICVSLQCVVLLYMFFKSCFEKGPIHMFVDGININAPEKPRPNGRGRYWHHWNFSGMGLHMCANLHLLPSLQWPLLKNVQIVRLSAVRVLNAKF